MHCPSESARALLVATYGRLIDAKATGDPELRYSIECYPESNRFSILKDGGDVLTAADSGEFLYCFDKDLTVELQRRRRGLFFLHSAAVARDGRAILIVASSGTGKSTTAWGLLNTGFGYLSDEIAPIDLDAMTVHPFPRALCLKTEPPGPYSLPPALRTATALHIPTRVMPSPVMLYPMPVCAILFLTRPADAQHACLRPLEAAEAAARLFTNALNALAHSGEGLDPAIRIAQQVACYELVATDLTATCQVVRDTLPLS